MSKFPEEELLPALLELSKTLPQELRGPNIKRGRKPARMLRGRLVVPDHAPA